MVKVSNCNAVVPIHNAFLTSARPSIAAALVVALALIVDSGRICFAQAADTPESALLKGQGAYLRGLGSYNLNNARAAAAQNDAVLRWKEELRTIERERRENLERKQGKKHEKAEETKRRALLRAYELRVKPFTADIQNGRALNALLYDLMNPSISLGEWGTSEVRLPEQMSVRKLVFQFLPVKDSPKASKVLSGSVIALSRLDVRGTEWPAYMGLAALANERQAYESAYARLREELIGDELDLESVTHLDKAVVALRTKVQTVVPKERGFQGKALEFVRDLIHATRMFDAETVDYAREILRDTKDQDATTVAELVSFMLKYRLQFASAAQSPSGRELYSQLYDALRQQANVLGIELPEPPHPDEVTQSPFQAKSVWSNGSWTLTVNERRGEAFVATYTFGKSQREVTGKIQGNKVSWLASDVRVIKGGLETADHYGTIVSGKEGDRIEIVWRNEKGRSGTLTVVRQTEK